MSAWHAYTSLNHTLHFSRSLGMDRDALKTEASKRLKHGEGEEQPKKKKVSSHRLT